MAFIGKVALFVEGEFTPRARLSEPFGTIWQQHLVRFLGLIDIDRVVPINKKNLVAMDKANKKLSGAGMMPLDYRIARELEKEAFDVAVVAWDLQPPWDSEAKACRRDEVLKLYLGLSESQRLPDKPWRQWARKRHRELSQLKKKRDDQHSRSLEAGAVLTVCMEPVFESLLIVCEQTIRRTLGIKDGGRVKWPTWDEHREQPERLLQLAIEAARQVKPKSGAIKLIPGDMFTAKHAWGEYLLRHMVDDKQCLEELRRHPTAARLVRLLSRGR